MKPNAFRHLSILLLATASLTGNAFAQANEKDKGEDHPLVSRYPGSIIHAHRQVAFDEYNLILGKINGKKWEDVEKIQELEGKVTKIVYDVAEGRSTLEVLRNYEQALVGAGFKVVWQAKGEDEIGSWAHVRSFFPSMYLNDRNQRYLVAHLKRPEQGDVYVALYLNDIKSVRAQLHVVEVKPIEQGMIKVDLSSEQMLKDIESGGRVAIYGIYFDTGKDAAKAESKTAIDEIGKLLKESPQMKILVVGHTDSVGSYDYNLDLSMRRSLSVVNAVVENHGIATERLKAAGAGMMSPVATNRSDTGRAENRRVELVEIVDQ